jgi:uncharacterized protein (DUF488 family)
MSEEGLTIWTVGHSTRTLVEFIELLTVNNIEALADVRRFPTSRHHPQFDKNFLRNSLAGVGVEYISLTELGGRRRPLPDSLNTVWRNESFRGFADYMETEGFCSGIHRLLELARRKRTAVMCAEALWWRCHRSLIADYLQAAGICVLHIIDGKNNEIHPYTSAACFKEGKLLYSP